MHSEDFLWFLRQAKDWEQRIGEDGSYLNPASRSASAHSLRGSTNDLSRSGLGGSSGSSDAVKYWPLFTAGRFVSQSVVA